MVRYLFLEVKGIICHLPEQCLAFFYSTGLLAMNFLGFLLSENVFNLTLFFKNIFNG